MTPTSDRWDDFAHLPALLTPAEVAQVLRIRSMKTLYTRKRRGQIPGVVPVGKRGWLVRKKDLLRSLQQGRAASSED